MHGWHHCACIMWHVMWYELANECWHTFYQLLFWCNLRTLLLFVDIVTSHTTHSECSGRSLWSWVVTKLVTMFTTWRTPHNMRWAGFHYINTCTVHRTTACECAYTLIHTSLKFPQHTSSKCVHLPIARLLGSNSEYFPHCLLICVLLEMVQEAGIG